MQREALVKKMNDLYGKARAARQEGKRRAAKTFRSGARRLQRQIKGLREEPAAAKQDAAPAEAEPSAEAESASE